MQLPSVARLALQLRCPRHLRFGQYAVGDSVLHEPQSAIFARDYIQLRLSLVCSSGRRVVSGEQGGEGGLDVDQNKARTSGSLDYTRRTDHILPNDMTDVDVPRIIIEMPTPVTESFNVEDAPKQPAGRGITVLTVEIPIPMPPPSVATRPRPAPRWNTPEFIFYGCVFITVVPLLLKIPMDLSQGSRV